MSRLVIGGFDLQMNTFILFWKGYIFIVNLREIFMKNRKFSWVNFFFMLLSVILIIFLIFLFFGVKFPTYKSINREIIESKISLEIDTNKTCNEIIYTPGHIEQMSIVGETEEKKNFYLEIECRTLCAEKYDFENKIMVVYESHSCEKSILICKCKTY